MEEKKSIEVKRTLAGNDTVYYGKAPDKGKKKKPLLIFVAILVAFIIMGIIIKGTSAFVSDDDKNASGASDIREDYVGVLYIEGTIGEDDEAYSQEYVVDAIDGMTESRHNKGMLLYVNTPGGGVYESDEVYLRIRSYQEKTGRPVYVYMASQATSGGYYISASADKIIANRNCWTGSIGVTMGTLVDISGLLDKYGIKTETITSGRNKAMGSMTEKLTAEQKKIMQSLIDEAYDQFVDIVASGRNMKPEEVRKIADGRIYTAKQAEKLGLIDEVTDSYESAESDMLSECGLEDCEVYDFRYVAEESLLESFVRTIDKASAAVSSDGDVAALTELMEKTGEVSLQYLCEVKK
ncbi:MAG: signal peptide peptidase SppA [Bacillota bacterium]|nr:signal peptide peptidase SppA [Bacillota bacterium]